MQARTQVIEAIAKTMDLYGATYSSGQLYGIMFFEDRPMTLDEMKTKMNMSKSNMSYAVRSLIESQMVKKLEEKLERKELFAAEVDFFQAFQHFFTHKLQREVDVMTSVIEQALPALREILQGDVSGEEKRLTEQDLHKLEHAEAYYTWLQQFVDRLRSGAMFRNGAGKE
ncbi:GbsR/MarR family transcriptional regulator [Paenibacillus guangzhouensis]|uniref:GbsR/MarR family transcriptional regulator n=1 Tax=Paenibacillus guangzhouensis TaxID=1473112 RepID=UPI001267659C